MAAKMEQPRTLGEKIRFLRMKQGLKQIDLARRLRISKTAVCQYEKGQTKPRAEHLSRLADILSASSRELRPPFSLKRCAPTSIAEDVHAPAMDK
jgi:transcriptional regulator with XRE-family HTH domain